MSKMDTFYRAYKAYRNEVSTDKEIGTFRGTLNKASKSDDRLKTVRTYTIIDVDWVEKIELEMDYVEKAIREDRQFIQQYGEVLPIEKIKRVSQHSVQHLAKHSELITKKPKKGEELVPDSLYMVENLSDYTVYENKFLYMLLVYLKDFITVRLDKILEYGKSYTSDFSIKKKISYNRRKFTFEATMSDVNKNDDEFNDPGNSMPVIQRIQDQYYMVVMLLNTPLMQEVAKVPILKPPITKTNVLRLNNNFKHAYELYQFLAAYDKPGYEVKEITNEYAPFPDDILDSFSEIITMQSLLAYQYGNKLTERLQEAFLLEEQRRKEEEDEEHKRQLAEMKKRAKKSAKSMEEYMLMLEKRNAELEGTHIKLKLANAQIKDLQAQIVQLNQKINAFRNEVKKLTEEIAEIKEEHLRALAEQQRHYEAEIARITDEYENRINELIAEYEGRLEDQKERFEALVEKLNDEHEEELRRIKEIHAEKLSQINEEHARLIKTQKETYERELALERERVSVLTKENDSKVSALEQLKWRKDLAMAELNGLRAQYGMLEISDDLTTRERFDELEEEFQAFSQFFLLQWARTKKQIRKDIMKVYPAKNRKPFTPDLYGSSVQVEEEIQEPDAVGDTELAEPPVLSPEETGEPIPSPEEEKKDE